MGNFTVKDKQIFVDMKECLKDLGLKISREEVKDDSFSGLSVFRYQGNMVGMTFVYDSSLNVAVVNLQYPDLPTDKLSVSYELFNHINNYLMLNHFFIDPRSRVPVLRSGYFVTDNILNKETFKMVLKENVDVGHVVMSLVNRFLSTNQDPLSIIDAFAAMRTKIDSKFNERDGKLKQ